MKDNFVPYQIALDMKELEFNEECFAYYNFKEEITFKSCYNKVPIIMSGKKCGIPTYSQAFNFFESKYGYFVDRDVLCSANEVIAMDYYIIY